MHGRNSRSRGLRQLVNGRCTRYESKRVVGHSLRVEPTRSKTPVDPAIFCGTPGDRDQHSGSNPAREIGCLPLLGLPSGTTKSDRLDPAHVVQHGVDDSVGKPLVRVGRSCFNRLTVVHLRWKNGLRPEAALKLLGPTPRGRSRAISSEIMSDSDPGQREGYATLHPIEPWDTVTKSGGARTATWGTPDWRLRTLETSSLDISGVIPHTPLCKVHFTKRQAE
jgi:hypothetical protein